MSPPTLFPQTAKEQKKCSPKPTVYVLAARTMQFNVYAYVGFEGRRRTKDSAIFYHEEMEEQYAFLYYDE